MNEEAKQKLKQEILREIKGEKIEWQKKIL
jgi:hypothetical protein